MKTETTLNRFISLSNGFKLKIWVAESHFRKRITYAGRKGPTLEFLCPFGAYLIFVASFLEAILCLVSIILYLLLEQSCVLYLLSN